MDLPVIASDHGRKLHDALAAIKAADWAATDRRALGRRALELHFLGTDAMMAPTANDDRDEDRLRVMDEIRGMAKTHWGMAGAPVGAVVKAIKEKLGHEMATRVQKASKARNLKAHPPDVAALLQELREEMPVKPGARQLKPQLSEVSTAASDRAATAQGNEQAGF